MPVHQAARRVSSTTFVLVVEGSIPNETNQSGRLLGCDGHGPRYPATDHHSANGSTVWPQKRWPWSGAGTCATYGGIHAMEGNPTGCMGLADYLGWGWKSKAGLPIVNVPGCPVQPDNFMETLLYLLYQLAGLAPMIPLDEALRPKWLFTRTVHDGCDRAGYYEQGIFATEYGTPKLHRQARLLGAGGAIAMSPSADGWPESAVARTSAGSASAAPCRAFRTSSCRSWTSRPAPCCRRTSIKHYGRVIRSLAQVDQSTRQRRTEMAAQPLAELTTGYRR